MLQLKGHKVLIESICVAILVHTVVGETDETPTIKPGRYVPELHGGYRGKYTPDESGKYIHIHRPYDGGYGDRGLKYVHASDGRIITVESDQAPGILPLGEKDHLRFMIDFNYDGTGWQIIKFDWLRDGDENYQYQIVNENQLWNGKSDKAGQKNGKVSGSGNGSDQDGDVHLDGDYNEKKGYDYSYTERKTNSNNKNLQNAIREVLEYLDVNVLPTL